MIGPVLPARAEVVVVGGGVMGAATHHGLAALGCGEAVLLGRVALGARTTAQCAGGVRTRSSDELNVRIGLECSRRLERFTEDTGQELDLRRDGYLFLLDVPAD